MKDGEKTISKLFEVIKSVASSTDGLDAHAISKQTAIPLSTVFRLLKFMCEQNSMRNSDGLYTLGPGFVRWGMIAANQNPLVRLAHPVLTELSAATLETVHLAELHGDHVVYVAKVEGKRPIRMASLIGSTSPLYCTGVGKAVLAFQEPELCKTLCDEFEIVPYTRNTVSSIKELRQELNTIRKNGYAVDDCEHEDGVYCIAAPVLDALGHAIAAVSVSGAAVYLKKQRALLSVQVRNAAAKLSIPQK